MLFLVISGCSKQQVYSTSASSLSIDKLISFFHFLKHGHPNYAFAVMQITSLFFLISISFKETNALIF